ncbi:MAG: AsmA-like C-terminal region-containing protein, partial [Minicystis sp.]
AVLDLSAGTLAAKSFDLGLGEAKAHGSASLRGLGATPEVDSFELKGSGDAAALLALLPPSYRPSAVEIEGPISLAMEGNGGRDQAQASLKIEIARLAAVEIDRAGKRALGNAVAVGLGADLTFTAKGGALQIADLKAHVGEVTVEGELAVEGLGASPSIKALTLRAAGPSELLLGLGPPARRPPGVALKGAFTASASAHGDAADLAGKVTIDLGKVSLRARGLAKPAGVPLSIEVKGHGSKAGATLERAALRLASLALTAHGQIKGAEQLDLSFDAKGGSLAPLLALSPIAAERLGRTSSMEGQLAASGTLRRGQGQTRLDAKIGLQKARIRLGVVLLSGAPAATVRVDVAKNTLQIKADADLGPAALVLAGLFTKPVGKASRVAFTLGREGEQLRVREARVLIPGLAVEGLDVSAVPRHLHVSAPVTTFTMAALTEAMPLLEGRVPPAFADATLRCALELDADPQQLDAASLHLRAVELVTGLGHLRGSVDLDGLPTPRAVRFQVLGGDLDLAAAAAGEPFELPGDDTGKIPVSGHVHLDRLALRGQTVRALDLDVSVAEAKVTLDRLHAELLGGTLDADKSWLDVSGVPALDLHARVTDLDLSQLPFAAKHDLQGRGSLKADLQGRGVSLDALARSLTGALRVSLREVRGKGQMVRKVTVVNPLLQRLAERMRKKQGQDRIPLHLREATALFDLAGNKLTSKEPILLRADAFTVRLDGTLGLDGVPALDGQIDIAAQAIAEATKGWLVPVNSIPLKLKLYGDVKELKVELIEITASLAALHGARENAVEGE